MHDKDSPLWPLAYSLLVIRRRMWIIALTAVVLTGTVVGLSFLQTPRYEASIKILVGQESDTPDAALDVFGLQQLTQTITEAVLTRAVAEAVIQRLDLSTSPESFLDNVEVQQIKASQFIQIDYTDTNADRARRVANAIGDALSERMSEINAAGDATITATVWDRAALPNEPSRPAPVRNGVLALVAGVLLGTMLAFLLEYLDNSWRSPEELEHFSGKPNLGVVPKSGNSDAELPKVRQRKKMSGENDQLPHRSLVTLLDPASAAAEAYRTLRTNLLYSFVDDPPKVIVVSSAVPREGKSFVCANLGMVLAQAEKSTLIMDCDLRDPKMHKIFGLQNLFGVADVLAGQHSLQEVSQESRPGLKVVTSGTLPADPVNLLGSERFAELLAQARQEFDYVLLDSPPIRAGSDAAVLAHQGDGILFVVDAQNTRRWVLQRSVRSLESVGANVLGTVMNNVESQEKEYRYG